MAVAGGVPWWVILLAVLAGILVLALLVFILWKVSEGDGVPAAGRVPSPWHGVSRGCRAVLDHPGRAVLPLPCHATPCCWATAAPCHAMTSAVPRCAVPSLTFSLPPQCGFFKRSSQTSRYTTNYYRARRRLQPSEADKQALEGQR